VDSAVVPAVDSAAVPSMVAFPVGFTSVDSLAGGGVRSGSV
jgi:hypothetical protein